MPFTALCTLTGHRKLRFLFKPTLLDYFDKILKDRSIFDLWHEDHGPNMFSTTDPEHPLCLSVRMMKEAKVRGKGHLLSRQLRSHFPVLPWENPSVFHREIHWVKWLPVYFWIFSCVCVIPVRWERYLLQHAASSAFSWSSVRAKPAPKKAPWSLIVPR